METYSASKNFRRTPWRLVLLAISFCLIPAHVFGQRSKPDPALRNIRHIVVIYQENWSFDSLYGLFPGANGLAQSSAQSLNQTDKDDNPFSSQTGQPFHVVSGLTLTTPPPPVNNGIVDPRFTPGLNTLLPYDVLKNSSLMPNDTTGDLVHRFWHEQSQINGGAMDWFVTWSDNPGLTMSYFDATNMPEGLLAQKYTMADNFFHAAFGGSFLNHQFLIAAAAPVYPNAPAGMQPTLDADGELTLDANGKIVHDGNITPIGAVSFTVPGSAFDKNYAVNTIFSTNLIPTFVAVKPGAPLPPSLLPSLNDSNPSDPTRPFMPTIGDRLNEKNISWKWYSGGWDNALASTVSNPANNGTPGNSVDPLFQWHHQPFAYYDNYAPFINGARNPLSAAHLQDEKNFFADLQTGSLPAVVFIKALGPDNEHPGYAGLLQGQQHVADLVDVVKKTDYWDNTLIIVTYDEHGGRWDHVTPPVTGIWGDGTRVPAIIIGTLAKRHFVDHTQYDTLSILRTIEARFGLEPLSALDAQANSLKNSLLLQNQQ